MKNLGKRVAEVQAIIDQAKKDDISGIEVDSTWESVYDFDKIVLLKTKLKVLYKEWDGIKTKDEVDITDLRSDARMDYEDTKYMLSWVKRCIKKGYRENAKEQKLLSQ
jgi:hypothetical protein